MSVPVRIVTAAALFDGHDAAINVIRRTLQDLGCEVIHLGHNRAVDEVAEAVVQEGAQGVCVSSYQGGHLEYFKYLRDALVARGASYVKIFGGGGGVIVHEEKDELEAYGITRIFHPDDGRRLGLEGMGRVIVEACAFDPVDAAAGFTRPRSAWPTTALGLGVAAIEGGRDPGAFATELADFRGTKAPPILGVTGTGGAGKSSLVDELIQRFKSADPDLKIGVVCVDPSKRRTGGALLGDRIRMNALERPGVFMRSQAARDSGVEIAASLPRVLDYLKGFAFDLLIAESSGIGQASSKIVDVCDVSLYVMTADFGAPSQLEKIDMIDLADLIAINKADRRGALDAHRAVARQYARAHRGQATPPPVFLTQASNFNDRGVNELFAALSQKLKLGTPAARPGRDSRVLVPADRQNYLAEIAGTVRRYKADVTARAEVARRLGALATLAACAGPLDESWEQKRLAWRDQFGDGAWAELESYDRLRADYARTDLEYGVRGQTVRQPLTRESLGGITVPRVVVPSLTDWGERWRYLRLENVPGRFPFTAGTFPLKRTGEEPTRQFAGEGTPARTNRRFHYLSANEPAKRLSTAFDSVTLYGEDPAPRPDIFGKVGESGVSVATLDDVKALYAGFDLCDPSTSVSMTINGPAPMLLAFYLNAAIDQQIEKAGATSEEERERIRRQTLATVRGTVQADILKEDQGQNTCIFSIDFAMRLMADVQEYFVGEGVRNFYSVSISGYHIAEAGAYPVTQLALTLANAFTYVEYYLSRGLKIDDFAPNLSFFFSNGLDPEYAVIGRVARRIWAIVMKERYGASARSQKLKYHVQTSGRSLHAQEIAFNDVRTTLQAFLAVADQCNSLHTNAYDEAITTPTEESVRRAQAIQLIITKEFGVAKNENPTQGSYFIERLTEAVEEAVLTEFLSLDARGGVLGAMESQYQRGRIQDESLHYETLKHDGTLPIVGVNTFVDPKTLSEDFRPPKIEMARATLDEKNQQLSQTEAYRIKHAAAAGAALDDLRRVAIDGGNVFASLMTAARVCTLGQMTHALFDVGGRYRRNV